MSAVAALRSVLSKTRSHGYDPGSLKLSVEAWDDLRPELPEATASCGVTLYGLPVFLDESLAPGTFGFEPRKVVA